MRIVHVTDYFHPKLGYQDAYLALAQIRAGHEVHVVTADRYRPFENYGTSVGPLLGPRILHPGVYQERGIVVHRLPVRAERRYRVWLVGLERTLRSLRPALIHVHGVANPSALRIALLKHRLPFQLIVDDHMVPSPQMSMGRRAFHAAFRATCSRLMLQQADVIASVTEVGKEFMIDAYGFPRKRVAVLPLGADVTLFVRSVSAREAYRSRFGYGPREVVFIYSGKLVPSKGAHILVNAAIPIMKEVSGVRLFLLGDGPGPYVQSIIRLAEDAGYAESILLHRAVLNAELPAFYSMADVGVWPERSSLTMIEAQACGLPIIVSSFPAAAERVAFGNGLVFPERDVNALAVQMRTLALDPELRESMGGRGREYVSAKLNYDAISDEFLRLAHRTASGFSKD